MLAVLYGTFYEGGMTHLICLHRLATNSELGAEEF